MNVPLDKTKNINFKCYALKIVFKSDSRLGELGRKKLKMSAIAVMTICISLLSRVACIRRYNNLILSYIFNRQATNNNTIRWLNLLRF